MKSGGFHHEIWQISPWNPWNPVDFTMKSNRFHEIHEIQWISPWNLVDFMKSSRFQVKSDVSEIRCRCFSKNSSDFYKVWGRFHLKSTGFHEIYQISPEICQISWNPPDFIRISWNPPDFMWNRKTFARNCNSMFSEIDGSSSMNR